MIFLVGFMGSGKSTVGRELARRLGWPAVDVDTEIERAEGMSIARIFETRGEPAFRKLENEAIRDCVARPGRQVVSLGGGAYLQQDNFDLLQRAGTVIWLDCPLEMVRARVGSGATRPLARDPEKMARLFEERRPLYARAHHRIAITSDDPTEAVAAILLLGIVT